MRVFVHADFGHGMIFKAAGVNRGNIKPTALGAADKDDPIAAGRPGVGKSALKLQIAIGAALQGRGVGIVSLEMGDAEIGFRALANAVRVNGTALSRGDPEESDRLKRHVGGEELRRLRDAPLWFDFNAATLPEVVSRITAWCRTRKIVLAIVDHIGLIDASGYTTRNDQLGAISRALKRLAMRLSIPILALSQLNRAVERDGRRPTLADLRDSGNLEQDADVVLMLHARDEAGVEVDVGILKNRSGPKGWLRNSLRFSGREQRFIEVIPPADAVDNDD